MSGILDAVGSADGAKIMLIGENGSGKTGSKASLIVAGYKLRSIDTDRGIRILRSLLTDPHYPYAKLVKERNIDLNDAVRYVSVDIPMAFREVIPRGPDGKPDVSKKASLLAPTHANAWAWISDQLTDWQEPPRWLRKPQEQPTHKMGNVASWGPEYVLDIDSFSTLSMMCYYHAQQLNGRLGARDEGYDYQRDVGSAQAQLRRFLELISCDAIRCNVIVNTHITRLDMSSGAIESPDQRKRDQRPIDARGFPSAIGRALSPNMGKYFNDIYVVNQSGSGSYVKRTISTVPAEVMGANVSAKNSVYLEHEYDISTGLLEIFTALRGQPYPADIINAIKGQKLGTQAAPQKSATGTT